MGAHNSQSQGGKGQAQTGRVSMAGAVSRVSVACPSVSPTLAPLSFWLSARGWMSRTLGGSMLARIPRRSAYIACK
ncbi:unnamed protein product [Boreogadus saida]